MILFGLPMNRSLREFEFSVTWCWIPPHAFFLSRLMSHDSHTKSKLSASDQLIRFGKISLQTSDRRFQVFCTRNVGILVHQFRLVCADGNGTCAESDQYIFSGHSLGRELQNRGKGSTYGKCVDARASVICLGAGW